jgi:hypothetical protein
MQQQHTFHLNQQQVPPNISTILFQGSLIGRLTMQLRDIASLRYLLESPSIFGEICCLYTNYACVVSTMHQFPVGMYLCSRELVAWTYFATVSESPMMVKERFGLVMATFEFCISPGFRRLWRGGGGLTVQPTFLSQKADFMFRIASDETHNNCFLFSSLESIYTAKLDARKCLLHRPRHQSKLPQASVQAALEEFLYVT